MRPRKTKSRDLPKPKTREAQLRWAETLGMEELGWIHGGQGGPCCPWSGGVTPGQPGCQCTQPYPEQPGCKPYQGGKR